jgi:hypothetical protein
MVDLEGMGDSMFGLMLFQCGSCGAQAIPILLNPLTWMVAIAAVTAVVAKTTPKREKK